MDGKVYKMPEVLTSPIAKFYCPIEWDDLGEWILVRFSTPMDGNCLFHSIANSFFTPYWTEILNDKHMSRINQIKHLRTELSNRLPEYYDKINGGNMKIFAESVPEFKLEYMQQQLQSQVPIGYGYMEFIGDILDKDIYILEAARKDIYKTDELKYTIKGNRNSIILYYMDGHYELVGLHHADGTFTTHFDHNHSLIKFLRNKVLKLI